MTIHRNQLLAFLDDLLQPQAFSDYCKNGLQIQGNPEITGLVCGVSISRALIDAALERNANCLLVHHGLLWQSPRLLSVAGLLRNRLKLLLCNDLNLLAYHLPLDAHPEVGNNISILRLFAPFNEPKPFDCGFIADLAHSRPKQELQAILAAQGMPPAAFGDSHTQIQRLAVVSGGGADLMEDAAAAGCQLFISGEIKEKNVRALEELGIDYFCCGHYNTERFGVGNLCRLIDERFDVPTWFVDIANPV